MNSDLQGPYRFDVFSDPTVVEGEARVALDALKYASARHLSGGEPKVLLPSLRVAARAAEHILASGLDSNLLGGDNLGDLRADKMAELSRALNRGAAMAELLDQGAGPEAVADLRGDVRIAYRSPVDGSDQPFCLFVPFDYDRTKPYPLMLRLHGVWIQVNEAEWTIQTFEWDREFVRYSPRGSFIEVYPYGRCNEGYRESGLRDVVDTMELAQELFNIDPDRVYLLGSSMGAAGAWRIASQIPDRFAALCCVVGAYDGALAEKVKSLPVMFHYGGQDSPERITSPQETAELLHQLGGQAEVVGHPESGHRLETTDYQLSYYRFFAQHRRG
jgi:poly(3-hydroxybutyrate) depolymerase